LTESLNSISIFGGTVLINFDLFEYYQLNKDRNIILTFKGAFSQEILVEIGDLLKKKFEVSKQIKKIFAVFVELSQNIMHYSAEVETIALDNKKLGVGIIIFTEDQKYFYITSGNLIKKNVGDRIKPKIDKVNTMNDEELKNYYSEQRRLPQEEGSKGAGLGFIDIARKSSGKIEYNIKELNDEHSFLILSVKFNKGEN